MRLKKNFSMILLGLMIMGIIFPSCRNDKKASENSGRKEINFYAGRDMEPIYSSSVVEKPHSSYVFEPALQGDIIKHDFIIKNDSGEILKLTKAEGCCGTVVSSYSQTIGPGMTGRISVLLLTDSRGGKEINGTIRAETNDPARPEITIDISLYVKEFAALNPYRIWLKGSPGEEIVKKSIVIPNENYPFNITGIKTRKGVWFDYDYKEIRENGQKAYEITVRNTRKQPGPYQDVLFVQTDNSARPEFKIRIEGRIGE